MRNSTRKFASYLTVNGFERLSYLFAASIIALWVQCFGDWWWEETYAVIYGQLIAISLIALAVPWRRLAIPLQAVALVAVNLIMTDFRWISPYPKEFGPGRMQAWLSDLTAPLFPFLWLSLGVWLIVLASVVLSKRKSGLITVVGAALLSLSVIDSLFTPIFLWQEVALIITIGLLWLVASHFEQFRQKHPDSWQDLLSYPLGLVASVVLIIGLVMGAGVFVPSIDPIVKDPYTAWKESRGEAVPSMIGDKIGIETVAKKGDSRSGYGRNDTALGSGFTFDYSPVMEVTTNHRSYWRGETKALYSGKGWEDARGEREEPTVTGIQADQVLASGRPEGLKTTRISQTVTMQRKDKFPVLFGAGPISSIVMVGEEGKPLPRLRWLPQSWELRLVGKTETIQYPQTYSIVSDVTLLDEEALRSIPSGAGAGSVSAMYLQLPDTLPERVRTLAADITRDQASAYDKVKAIEAYLQSNFTYNNEPDLTNRTSEDLVDGFLFQMKEGYCDYFSTSMAVMVRTLGIPARWVKGYSPGTLPVDPSMAGFRGEEMEFINPEGEGTYTVRNSDAHSWVEVYFPGYGWLPFEPTTGFSYPYVLPEDAPEPAPVELPADLATTPVVTAPEAETSSAWGTVALIAGAIILVAAGAFILFRFRKSVPLWPTRGNRYKNANERVVRETERLLRFCRRKGFDRIEHETMRETMDRWSSRFSSLQPEFRRVQSAFEKAKYSAMAMTEDDVSRFEQDAKSIRERLSS
ncbi:transglutaminase domain-containing protein [Paenibacillus aurantiacus]|uniref:Transglutaminase domain-containing protein n=1 Tax=Paenibacillus aurantiacus TaxID=1936118 RepID=A0ABV5KJZ2_9BACL